MIVSLCFFGVLDCSYIIFMIVPIINKIYITVSFFKKKKKTKKKKQKKPLMDYQQQIVFLIGPINHCLSIKILLYLIQCFKTFLIKK